MQAVEVDTPVPEIDQDVFLSLQDSVLAVLAGQIAGGEGDDRPTVLRSLTSYQTPDIVANFAGEAMLVYDQPLPGLVWWAEYDPDLAQLIFVTVTGQIFAFGTHIHESVDKYLRLATTIQLVQVDAVGKIINAEARRIIVRRNGWQ